MKRSEMIKHIANDLKEIIMENFIDKKGEEWCAHAILLGLEEKGMLPPFSYEVFDSNLAKNRDVSVLAGNEWEPE